MVKEVKLSLEGLSPKERAEFYNWFRNQIEIMREDEEALRDEKEDYINR